MTDRRSLTASTLKELTNVRTRGYVRLDSPDLVALMTPLLETAATRVPGYHERLTRVALVELLLKHEIGQLPEPYKSWLAISFGLKDGLNRLKTDDLRQQAANLASKSNPEIVLRGAADREVFRRGKEREALNALAAQIVADCFTEPDQEVREERSVTPSRIKMDDRREQVRQILDPEVQHAVQILVATTRRELQQQKRERQVSDPFPLSVRWANVHPDRYMDHWENIHGNTGSSEPVDLAGTLENVASTFDSVPSGRLVVLGGGGAGKTTLVAELALALLAPERRSEHEPVPIIFPMTSWDPLQQSLEGWMIARLIEDHEVLQATSKRRGSSLAGQLVQGGHIIPILDGFDEIAPGLRSTAIRVLNASLNYGDKMVLTSRTQEYVDAVNDSDVLTHAPVVVLEGLTVDDIASYLPLTAPKAKQVRKPEQKIANLTKWDTVLASMRSSRDDPHSAILLDVLSTPLMVSLARSIYSDTSADPNELLDASRFPDAAALSSFLFDQYVESVYESPVRGLSGGKRGRSYQSSDAREWLEFLAAMLHSQRMRDFAWWNLNWTTPHVFIMWGGVLAFAVGLGLVIWKPSTLLAGLVLLAVGYGISFGFATERAPRKLSLTSPRRKLSRKTILVKVALASIYAVTITVFALWGESPSVEMVVVVGGGMLLVYGLLLVGDARFIDSVNLSRSVSPKSLLRADRLAAAVRGVCVGAGFVVLLALVSAKFGTANLWLYVATGMPLVVGAFMLASASGVWAVSSAWIAATGRLPWRTARFLDDAHKRGILRQVGALYQFRHALLQDRLARNFLGQSHQRRRGYARWLRARSNLARVRTTQDRTGETETELRAVLELQRRILGQGHQDTLDTWYSICITICCRGQFVRTIDELRSLREAQRQSLSPEDSLCLNSSLFLARVLASQGIFEESAAEFSSALEILEKGLRCDHSFLAEVRRELAAVEVHLHRDKIE